MPYALRYPQCAAAALRSYKCIGVGWAEQGSNRGGVRLTLLQVSKEATRVTLLQGWNVGRCSAAAPSTGAGSEVTSGAWWGGVKSSVVVWCMGSSAV